MSKLEELIQQLCPDGVEYKRLGDVLVIKNGRDYKSFKSGNVPVYGSGGIMAYIDTAVYDKPSVLIPRKGSLEKLYYVDKPFWNVDTIFYTEINTELVCPKFVYYWLAKQHLERLNKAGGVPSLTQAVLNKITIPVPPLEIQREIVRILDHFTELTTELTAELTARKKQYEYYRDRLLAFDVRGGGTSNVVWRTFGEVATIVRGASPRPIQSYITDDENGVPWIKIGDVPVGSKYITGTAEKITEEGSKKSRHINPGDFVLSNSMSFGRPYISKIHGCIHDGWLSISNFEDSFVPDFLYHLLSSTTIQNTLAQKASRGTVQNLNADIVKSLELPIPPFDVQNRIAKVLDNFETICSDLNIGLPAEIEARQKQYEYYRDKLLTFKPLT